jgi:ribonuclease HI
MRKRKGIAVDGWCSNNPGPGGYRGVDLETGKTIFSWDTNLTTNNLVEFIAVIHAMKWIKRNNLKVTIWTDSQTAMSWTRNKNCKTKFDLTKNNELKKRVDECMRFITENDYKGLEPLRKWDTKRWGEIPADFGRK